MNQVSPEVSVVIPCLDEAGTVAECVREALAAIDRAGLSGEVIVADNGSGDDSASAAASAGARVVAVSARGYGSALMTGIENAQGRFIVMGDADGSYDFGEIPRLVFSLREGFDLVQGCRLPRGAGRIAEGAMPWLHRTIGNPALTWLARILFGVRIHDVYCGLRGFTKEFYLRMNLRCTGMEFATEMIIKAARHGAKCREVPVTLRRDGRGRPSHLRTFRDGWRTLRLFLLYSPRWVFLFPSLAMLGMGVIGGALALPGLQLGGVVFGVHTLLVAGVCLLLGQQGLFFALFTGTFSVREKLSPPNPFLTAFYRHFTLERGLALGVFAALGGLGLIAWVFFQWRAGGYGPLDYPVTMRRVVPGVALIALSAQAIFASFVISLISLDRK